MPLKTTLISEGTAENNTCVVVACGECKGKISILGNLVCAIVIPDFRVWVKTTVGPPMSI